MGVGGWVGAHTGKSVGTHQPPKCEWRGVEPWLCVWQKECAHPHHHHQQEEDKGGQGQKGQGLVGQKEGGRGTNTTTHHKQARKHNGGVTNNNTHTKPQQQEEEEEERREREVEARGRKGGAASTRHSECVGGVWHTRGTNHTPHPLNTQRERETGKGKGQEKRQRKTKDKEWCMGVVVMEKQEASKLVTHHHFAPHFFPTPFFSLPPFFTPSLFPLFKTPNIMDYLNFFSKTTNTLLQTKLKLKEKTIQNERTQANLSASLFPDNSPTYNPLSHTPVVFWLSAYIFPYKSNYSFSHSYSIKPYKLSTNKQTQQPSCAITLHTFPSGCHLNT